MMLSAILSETRKWSAEVPGSAVFRPDFRRLAAFCRQYVPCLISMLTDRLGLPFVGLITQQFHTVLLSNIPRMSAGQASEARSSHGWSMCCTTIESIGSCRSKRGLSNCTLQAH